MLSDPIEFELFKNSLFSVADEMALTIFRTTYSGDLPPYYHAPPPHAPVGAPYPGAAFPPPSY